MINICYLTEDELYHQAALLRAEISRLQQKLVNLYEDYAVCNNQHIYKIPAYATMGTDCYVIASSWEEAVDNLEQNLIIDIPYDVNYKNVFEDEITENGEYVNGTTRD